MLNTVLLIIAYQGYQPIEYGITHKVLEDAGIKVVVASNKIGLAHAMPSAKHSKVCDDQGCTNIVKKYPEYAGLSHLNMLK